MCPKKREQGQSSVPRLLIRVSRVRAPGRALEGLRICSWQVLGLFSVQNITSKPIENPEGAILGVLILIFSPGVSNVNLSKIKTGKISAIRFSTLEAICEVLNCQPGDILEYTHGEKLN